MNKADLTEVLATTEAVFRNIVLSCEEKEIVNSEESKILINNMTGQSLQARAGQLAHIVQTVVKYCPDQLDVFLCILQEKGNLPVQVIAERIATTCESIVTNACIAT